MKKVISLLLGVILLLSVFTPAGAAHVTAPGAIETLETLGLVRGTGNGFEPERTATRAEAVTMLVRLLGREAAAEKEIGRCPFADGGWASPYITYAYKNGLVIGQRAGWFGSETPVQIRDYLTMLLRALGYSTANGDFSWSGSIAFADSIGLTHGEYTAQTEMLREDLALMSYTALTLKLKNSDRTLIEQLYLDGAVSASDLKATRLSAALSAGKTDYTAAEIHEMSADAVVMLELFREEEDFTKEKPSSHASAFFVTADGAALTSWHALDGVAHARAITLDGRRFDVSGVLWYDVLRDIAVIRISRTDTEGNSVRFFPYLDIGDSDAVYNGEPVVTVSNAPSRQDSVTDGIISSRNRIVDDPDYAVLQFTAPISPGSSGGPLLNMHGEVVGVLYGSFVGGDSMYLAVPVNCLPADALICAEHSFEEAKAMEEEKKAAASLQASETEVKLKVNESTEVLITHDCPRPVTIRYEIDDTDIVVCEWGNFSSKFSVPLSIYGLSRGETDVKIMFADGTANEDACVTIHVTVTGTPAGAADAD